VSRVALPRHHCESMHAPFSVEGWTVVPLDVSENLEVRPDAFRALLADPAGLAVLHAPYFGVAEAPEALQALVELEAAGVPVIVDETHRTTSPTAHRDRIRIASLRKLLPVPDGAYVVGLPERPDVPGAPSGAATLRESAMRLKSDYLAGRRDVAVHRPVYLQAEELTDRLLEPAPMSRFSAALLPHLDYEAMSLRRRENARAFIAALRSDVYRPVTAYRQGEVPSSSRCALILSRSGSFARSTGRARPTPPANGGRTFFPCL
jgi:hypothetical protein